MEVKNAKNYHLWFSIYFIFTTILAFKNYFLLFCFSHLIFGKLYRQPSHGNAKYHSPNTLIGPEFIVRSSDPTALVHIGDLKVTHKKKVLVILLNGQKLEISCDSSSTTFSEIFQIVVHREQIEYSVTVGLACLISDDFVFPPEECRLSKVAPANWSKSRSKQPPFTIYLRFRLYLPSLRGTRSWKWKHMLYLQLRRSILERQIRAEKHQLLALAGLALQAEFGDQSSFQESECCYFLLEHYMPDGEGSERELMAMHRQRSGLDPGRAEEMFITNVMSLVEYGTHYVTGTMVGKEETTTEMWLGVNSKGVVLSYKRDFNSLTVREPHYTFQWPDIKKLSYSKHFFEIVSADSKYKLKLEDNKGFYFFRLAWLHHKFFMKLTNEVTSLQNLADEFSTKERDGRKNVFHVSPEKRPESNNALRRAASLLSPDRAIFRGKTATHCAYSIRSESCRESRVSSPLSSPLSALNTTQLPKSSTLLHDNENVSRNIGARRRVLMGTRAIYSNSQHDLRCSSHIDLDLVSPVTPLPEAYVVNTNIRCENDNFPSDFHESISGSLAEKFNETSFINDRVLTKIRLERDKDEGLGLQVAEGKDGHAYVISTVIGTPANNCGLIYPGDQIQAVNGLSVLNLPYREVLCTIQSSGNNIELVLSQVNKGQKVHNRSNTNASPRQRKVIDSTGFDLLSVLQKPIEESYFNAIRYQIATELDNTMMATEVPRPLSYL
ncbi:hypothetical protein O3M35_009481 [Rhynocoris fuscipes]|uniref:Uncharacterized protein n=1 Tax=Rhynocoris fuscipes TaxID=488301 RepID=A0AAW1D4C2_9HEMI